MKYILSNRCMSCKNTAYSDKHSIKNKQAPLQKSILNTIIVVSTSLLTHPLQFRFSVE